MPKINITEETRNKAIRLYRNKTLTLREISNLVGLSEKTLQLFYREEFVKGTLKPRREAFALKPRVPNGQGTSRYMPTGVGKGGRNKERKKFTDEQEREIAIDYYENGLTVPQIKEKWGLHPVQLQRIRKTYGQNYQQKKVGRRKGEVNDTSI